MISFIVPAYNEELLLGRTLAAIHDSARPLAEPYEIIVADDASTDHTPDIALQHAARVVPTNNRQIAATRNAGARAATGEILIFVDADTLVTPAAVHAAVAAIRAGAAGGGSAFRFEGRLPFHARLLEKIALPIYRMFRLASGCFLFSSREAFLATGGFDETLFASEEAHLSRALRRQGPFVILREFVITSGRKLRAHSARELLSLLGRFLRRGPKSLRTRDGLDIWYAPRRPDPG